MASQRRKAKEDFFRGLENAGLRSDSDEDEQRLPGKQIEAKSSSTTKPSRRRKEQGTTADPTKPTLRKAVTTPQDLQDSASRQLPKSTAAHQVKPATGNLKRANTDNGNSTKQAKRKGNVEETEASALVATKPKCFHGLTLLFIPNRGLTRLKQTQIAQSKENDAKIVTVFEDSVTHIVADKTWTLDQVLKELPSGYKISSRPMVQTNWVVESIVLGLRDPTHLLYCFKGTRVAVTPVEASTSASAAIPTTPEPGKSIEDHAAQHTTPSFAIDLEPESMPDPNQDDESRADELDEILKDMDRIKPSIEAMLRNDPSFQFEGDYQDDEPDSTSKKTPWACRGKNERSREADNPNALAIRLFRLLYEIYAPETPNFRARAFKMAASTLSRQSVHITTKEEALKLPGIGPKIAANIEEIFETGQLLRLETMAEDPHHCTRQLFSRIYGVGHVQASTWTAAGWRTLEDLVANVKLTPNQKIGIEHFDDFETRIPRAEVAQHANIVKDVLESIDSELKMTVGGSYRRGSDTSGDVDILITKVDAKMEHIRAPMVQSVIPHLQAQGFIVAELASGRSSDHENTSKWMGACCLPGSTVWRRLDLLFVPWEELGAALIYWTGNDIFNCSIRLLASRSNMRLNQHGLYKNVLRGPGRVKLTEGELVESHSEKEIFRALGVPYRHPTERNP